MPMLTINCLGKCLMTFNCYQVYTSRVTPLCMSYCSNMEEVLEYTASLEPEEEEEVLGEAKAIRDVIREQCKTKARPQVNLDLPQLRCVV